MWWLIEGANTGILLGLLLGWAGIFEYHICNATVKGEGIPEMAFAHTAESLSEGCIWLCSLGIVICTISSGLRLIMTEDMKFLGVMTGCTISMSAWYLFRIEGRSVSPNPSTLQRDLWAPVVSHVVLSILAVVLVVKNANFGLLLIGGLCAQTFFVIMIFINYTFGLVVLGVAPILVLAGYAKRTRALWSSQKPIVIIDPETDPLIVDNSNYASCP